MGKFNKFSLGAILILSLMLGACNQQEVKGKKTNSDEQSDQNDQGRKLSSDEINKIKDLEHEDPIAPVDPVQPLDPVPTPTATTSPTDSCALYSKYSDKDLFALGLKGIGKCTISDATACAQCACRYYVKSSIVGWSARGWPLNPISQNSTGCVSQTQWNGYTAQMATTDLIHNGAEQLRNAICHKTDPCAVGANSSGATVTTSSVLK